LDKTTTEDANWWPYATDEEKYRYTLLGGRMSLKKQTISEAAKEREAIRNRAKQRKRNKGKWR
jgi:hypothetical protein